MGLTYQSTRGGESGVTASMAILQGLAKDGGLFMPAEIPKLDVPFEVLAGMTYQETAYEVMKLFLTDFTEEELKSCIDRAYDGKFDTEEIAPLAKADGAYYLELYHGSTIAFKDMALSILPHLMTTSARKNKADKEIVILTATSGDTGKAAMAGFADVPGTRIIVFYPKNGVSKVQELQMRTQKGDNTSVVAIHGNFDDAQTGVKNIFGNRALEEEMASAGFQFSSANSINIGRLVPQVVYYVYAYAKLLANQEIGQGEEINVVVPTGNFGNILAAYFAKKWAFLSRPWYALPMTTRYCTIFCYRNLRQEAGIYPYQFPVHGHPYIQQFRASYLPERRLRSGSQRSLMKELAEKGSYTVTPAMREFMSDFTGGFATEAENAAVIKQIFEDTGYLVDTHTGVAAAVYKGYKALTGDGAKTVIASTASPYKFSHSVMEAIAGSESLEGRDEFQVVDELSRLTGTPVPGAVEEIRNAPVRHNLECGVDKMEETVKNILGI